MHRARSLEFKALSLEITAFLCCFLSLGGGGNLTCPMYGVVPFLGYLFHDRVRGFMGMVFSNFLYFPDLWKWFSVRIHLLVSCFGNPGFMGMIFRKFSGFMGGTFTS